MPLLRALPLPVAQPWPAALLARRAAAVATLLALFLGPLALTTAAADTVQLEARVLLQGHTRVGSWMAIEVKLTNGGPAVRGELRIAGGSQGRTRFSVAEDLPTDSRKTDVLYAQPAGIRPIDQGRARVRQHDGGQRRRRLPDPRLGPAHRRRRGRAAAGHHRRASLDPGPNGSAPAIVPLGPADLPERLEGWATLDRLIWQDVDSSGLTDAQLAALRLDRRRRTAGHRRRDGGDISTLSSFPDHLSPTGRRLPSTSPRPRSQGSSARCRRCPRPARARRSTRGRARARRPRAPGRRRPARLREWRRHPDRLRPDDRLAHPGQGRRGDVAPVPAQSDRRRTRHSADDGQIVGAVVGSWPRSPCRRSAASSRSSVRHPPHRPDQLPRPAPPRSTRARAGSRCRSSSSASRSRPTCLGRRCAA